MYEFVYIHCQFATFCLILNVNILRFLLCTFIYMRLPVYILYCWFDRIYSVLNWDFFHWPIGQWALII